MATTWGAHWLLENFPVKCLIDSGYEGRGQSDAIPVTSASGPRPVGPNTSWCMPAIGSPGTRR